MAEYNYLIGFGERLTEPIRPASGGGSPAYPYTFLDAQQRLIPMAESLSIALTELPEKATPAGQAVAAITMHPQFVARSYFPDRILRSFGAEVVGSRPVTITPDCWGKKHPPADGKDLSSKLYLSASTEEITKWANYIQALDTRCHDELRRLEDIHAPSINEKLKSQLVDNSERAYEVVLHASDDPANRYIIQGFKVWCEELQAEPDIDRRFSAAGLTFIPVITNQETILELAQFSFLRVVRPMPQIRNVRPTVTRSIQLPDPVILPDRDPVDTTPRPVVFDGGLPIGSDLERWCNTHDTTGVGSAEPYLTSHGHSVTSALLFNSLDTPAPIPYSYIDHFRVLDKNSEDNPTELYDVLRRIEDVLVQRKPAFVNFSIGPRLPIEDDEVHAWTALIDDYCANTPALITVAVGNDGELDWDTGNARVQVPGDSVNSLSVGAASRPNSPVRASYSCVGPGRSTGTIKPDLIAFGGSSSVPFHVADPDRSGYVLGTYGTSFSAPATLRTAVGIRAILGDTLNPLTLKGLLIHCANNDNYVNQREIGWGMISADVDHIIICPEGSARIVYQGSIDPAKYVRALLPLPSETLRGKVTVTATITFACEVDPQDPSAYTRAGLEVFFRPNAERYHSNSSLHPKTGSFFPGIRDKKWENVLHARRSFFSTTLRRPVFDLHYLARHTGTNYPRAPKLHYSLIITIEAPGMPDLYNQILRTYPNLLEALSPVVEIPVLGS